MNTSNQVPSIHDSFNARTLTTTALCDSFIVNDHFPKLAGPNHSIMIGPRGSGKTTLMKMLQVEALDYWHGIESTEYRKSVSFSGVFIPTDRLWKQQYSNLTSQGSTNKYARHLLNTIFVLHVLERFTWVLEYRTNRNNKSFHGFKTCKISKQDESELCQELANSWSVTPSILSLRSLKLALSERKVRLSTLVSKQEVDPDSETSYFPDLVPALEHAVNIANTYLNEPNGKWCFLFDELELAPESLVQPLIDSIRGGPENIIFKLSLSPYHGDIRILETIESPMERQDFSLIDLSQVDPKRGEKFANALCDQIFSRRGFDENIQKYLEEPEKFNTKEIFESLSKKDPSFAHYLNDQKIDLKKIDSYKEKEKRTLIRKIQFVAFLRNFFLNDHGGLRSIRRAPDYYAGFSRLCRAMEYNPRMLIGMTNSFIDFLKEGNTTIPVQTQIKILEDSLRSFKALLNTIPTESRKFATVYSIVDHLGKYSAKKYIKGPRFYAEPISVFQIDNNENKNLIEAVGYGLNAGAFVREPLKKDLAYTESDNLKIRFRLSYIFSHDYGLLMTSSRHMKFPDPDDDQEQFTLL